MRITIGIAPLFLLACQEYNIQSGSPDFNGPNPPALLDPTVSDRIVQVTNKSVDVLWVVDNSGSMSDNQNALTTNFPAFMNYFLDSGLDYHIGVVSTDMDNNAQSGKLVAANNGKKYITPDDHSQAMSMFAQMASLGTFGSGDEKGRASAFTALELLANTFNAGFLRDDLASGVHVVVISDENDSSTNNPISKDEFIDYMNGLRGDPDLVTWNSICKPPGTLDAGTDYVDLTNGIGGIMHDIRVNDWVSVLEQLGVQAAGLKREYFLSRLPVADSIDVKVTLPDGTVEPFKPSEWTYSEARNSVTFVEYLPPPLAEVDITYTAKASTLGAPGE